MKRWIAIGCLAWLACSSADAQGTSTMTNDIYEAVFRHLFVYNGSGLTNASAFYLSVEGKDPGEEFLKRFAGNTPPVKKASECRQDADTGRIWDKADNPPGSFSARAG